MRDFFKNVVSNAIAQVVVAVIVPLALVIWKWRWIKQKFIPWLTSGVLLTPLLIGIVILATVAFVFIISLIIKKYRKQPTLYDSVIVPKPDNPLTFRPTHYGVNWEISTYSPWGVLRQGKLGEDIWVDGPYCPKCGYELHPIRKCSTLLLWKSYHWLCKPCNQSYPRPRENQRETEETVKRIWDSRFRHGNLEKDEKGEIHLTLEKKPKVQGVKS